MSQEFRRVTTEDVNEHLRLVVEDRLQEIIAGRHPGHCMRVGDLDTAVMFWVLATTQRAGVSRQGGKI